jgi:hypothetical protein
MDAWEVVGNGLVWAGCDATADRAQPDLGERSDRRADDRRMAPRGRHSGPPDSAGDRLGSGRYTGGAPDGAAPPPTRARRPAPQRPRRAIRQCAAPGAVDGGRARAEHESRPGNPYDNAAMESFMATYKGECMGLAQERSGYATRAAATTDFFAHAETCYNRVRFHSALALSIPCGL